MSFCSAINDVGEHNWKVVIDSSKSSLSGVTNDATGNVVGLSSLVANLINSTSNETSSKPPTDLLTPSNLDPAKKYATNAKALRDKLEYEYCYYYKRYNFGLDSLLKDAANGIATTVSSTGVSTPTPEFTTKKNNVIDINKKLNQLIQIMREISAARASSLQTYYGENTGINQVNETLDKTRDDLIAQTKLLESGTIEVNAKQAMIDYTIEKNNSSRNFLAVYGFMNIVAVGLLYYMYKVSK